MRIFEGKSQIERLSFFSDAVIAIAITLLALELKFDEETPSANLTFKDLLSIFPKFAAFLFSFIIIAVIWNIRYELDQLIAKIDERVVWATFVCLFFVATVPFSAALVSNYFLQPVSTFVYSVNILMLALCLNYIWDYLDKRPHYFNSHADEDIKMRFRVSCNVGVVNGVIAVLFSFVFPAFSFFILLMRPITTYFVKLFYRYKTPRSH